MLNAQILKREGKMKTGAIQIILFNLLQAGIIIDDECNEMNVILNDMDYHEIAYTFVESKLILQNYLEAKFNSEVN